MKGLSFRSSLVQNHEPPSEQSVDIRSVLPPPPMVYLRRPPSNQSDTHIYITEESIPKQIKKIINEVQSNSSLSILDVLILLRKGKQLTKYNKDKIHNGIMHCYLGVTYYKTGLLEEAFQQFIISDNTYISANPESKSILMPKNYQCSPISLKPIESKWLKIRARIHLQLCILLSEIQRHEMALRHAQIGIKFFYEVVINYLLLTRGNIINRIANNRPYLNTPQTSVSKSQNLIAILEKLVDITKDLKFQYLSRQKTVQIQSQNNLVNHCQLQFPTQNVQQFVNQATMYQKWLLTNKILNQVQMEIFTKKQYTQSNEVNANDVMEIIVYLCVGFYCLSTESRFIEKDLDSLSLRNILQSQSWLSRSLEVAYTFLPVEAPILGQIYSVHDKFYGLGKQPIPQDGQIAGHFRFLKQMRKVSSICDKKTMLLCAPVLIRINPLRQYSYEKHSSSNQSKHIKMRSLTIDLNNPRVKPQLKRNSLQKIYKKSGRKLSKIKGSSSLQRGNSMSRVVRQQQQMRPLSTDFGLQKLSKMSNSKIDIEINNSFNLFISNPGYHKSFDDKAISLQSVSKQKQPSFFKNKRMILNLIPGCSNPKQLSTRRNMYHIKRKNIVAKDFQLTQL